MRFTPLFFFLFSVVMCQAQSDTVKRGTIHIRKAGSDSSLDISRHLGDSDTVKTFVGISTSRNEQNNINTPFIQVENEYAVYQEKGGAPRLGKIKGSRLKYIKSKDLRSFGMNEENPIPISGRNLTNKTEVPYTETRPVFTDTIWDISKYLADTIHLDNWKSGRPDTIQLKVVIDKKGNYKYSFASRQDSLDPLGAKCMEALTTIRKWQPAHVYSLADGQKKDPKKKSAYSEILMTIVVNAGKKEEDDQAGQ